MKLLIMSGAMLMVLAACNLQEGIKETGDAVQHGAQNAVEAVKKVPGAISEASNQAEADIKEQSGE